MISISLSALLIPFGLAVAFFVVLAFINVYHLVHYGATTGVSFLVTFLFLAGGVFVLFFTWQELRDVDWSQSMDFGIPLMSAPAKAPLMEQL